MLQTSNPAQVIPTRRIAFEDAIADLPKHSAVDGDLILSHLAAAMSSVFPDGEDYFVRSVRRFRDQITDPDLKRQVNGFIGQEAMHGREHRMLNARLAELGYPTRRYEKLTRWGLEMRERITPAKSNLAVTAALEHFTATLGEQLLTSQATRDLFGDETLRDLFLWHALEETEHKSVAFDVYKAVGGSERMRVMVMRGIRVGFVASMAVMIAVSLLGDRETYRRGKLRASWRRFRRSPLMTDGLWAKLKDYDRRDFHPDDRDTAELLEHWRSELFGDDGRLNELLSSSKVAA